MIAIVNSVAVLGGTVFAGLDTSSKQKLAVILCCEECFTYSA